MKTFRSGPIAAQISRDDDGFLHLDDVVAEFPDDASWFHELWSNVGGKDTVGEGTGEGRKVFIVFGRLVAEACGYYEEDCDEFFELAGVW